MITRSRMVVFMVTAMVATIVSFFACIAHGAELKDSGKVRDVATCNDGAIYSNSTGRHQGACRGHHGVKSWTDGSAVKSHKSGGHYRKAGETVSMLDLSTVDPDEGSILPAVTNKGNL